MDKIRLEDLTFGLLSTSGVFASDTESCHDADVVELPWKTISIGHLEAC